MKETTINDQKNDLNAIGPKDGDYIVVAIPEEDIVYASSNYEDAEAYLESTIDGRTYGVYHINGENARLIAVRYRVFEIERES